MYAYIVHWSGTVGPLHVLKDCVTEKRNNEHNQVAPSIRSISLGLGRRANAVHKGNKLPSLQEQINIIGGFSLLHWQPITACMYPTVTCVTTSHYLRKRFAENRSPVVLCKIKT